MEKTKVLKKETHKWLVQPCEQVPYPGKNVCLVGRFGRLLCTEGGGELTNLRKTPYKHVLHTETIPRCHLSTRPLTAMVTSV